MLLAAPAANAAASASVRFVHAIPGEDSAELSIDAGGGSATLEAGFGEVSDYRQVDAGAGTFELAGGEGSAEQDLRDGGRYTVVALGGDEPRLEVLEDGRPRGGVATLRTIHAAPELGDVDVRLGSRDAGAGLKFGDASDYGSFEPGTYEISVARAGGDDEPLVSAEGVTLTAGSASTAVIVGSAGEPLEVVTVADATATPKGAPATGLPPVEPGGAGPAWPLIAWAALAAALLGLLGYATATGGRRRRGDRAA